MLYNSDDVKKILPHRSPFLFVDTVEAVTKNGEEIKTLIPVAEMLDAEAVTNFFVDPNHPIAEGHFPGNPIVPGVVQIEMMAQASCFTITPTLKNPLNSNLEVALLGVTSAKFRKPIVPGMHLEIHSHCTRVRGPVMCFDGKILCDGNVMAESSIIASVHVKQ